MALSNLEGSTIGGLDEGRGHNARILAFKGTLTLADITAACVSSVTKDGTVTNTGAGATLVVGYGHGLTLETPVLTDDANHIFKLTFGVDQTTAVTASTEQLTIQVATINAYFTDNSTGTIDSAVPAACIGVNGNQITFHIGEVTVNGADIAFANTDTIDIHVVAFATPA